jgi:hypothetical protein
MRLISFVWEIFLLLGNGVYFLLCVISKASVVSSRISAKTELNHINYDRTE